MRDSREHEAHDDGGAHAQDRLAHVPEDHGDQRARERGGRVEVVAAEDARDQACGYIADHAAADRRHDAQEDRRHDREARVEGLDRAGRAPTSQHHAVGDHEEHRPRARIHAEGHRDESADDREPQVVGVRDGDGRTGARGEEQVTDHSARERRHDRENAEANGVEVAFAGYFAAEDAVEENAHEVDGSEDLGQGVVQRVEQVHGDPEESMSVVVHMLQGLLARQREPRPYSLARPQGATMSP